MDFLGFLNVILMLVLIGTICISCNIGLPLDDISWRQSIKQFKRLTYDSTFCMHVYQGSCSLKKNILSIYLFCAYLATMAFDDHITFRHPIKQFTWLIYASILQACLLRQMLLLHLHHLTKSFMLWWMPIAYPKALI